MLKESTGTLESEAAAASASLRAAAAGGAGRVGSGGGLRLARLSRGELAGLGVAALTELLGGIERHVNQAAGYRVEVLAALDAAGAAEGLRDASSPQAVRDATGVSDRSARELCRVAAKARGCEPVMDALGGGDINTEQAESLSDARVPNDVRDRLIAGAVAESTDETKRRVRAAEAQHSRETPEQRFARQRARRRAQWGTDVDGMLYVRALLDPEIGARAAAALSAISQAMWRDDKHLRTGRRTPAQRDADALAYLLCGATLSEADAKAIAKLTRRPPGGTNGNTAPPEPEGTKSPPTPAGTANPVRQLPGAANRNTPQREPAGTEPPPDAGIGEIALQLPGGTNGNAVEREPAGTEPPPDAGTGVEVPPDAGTGVEVPPGFVHEAIGSARPDVQLQVMIEYDALRGRTDAAGITDAGTELAPEIVRKLACDAEIIPIMLNAPGGSADIGRARRTVPARLRRALIARDRHCVWPGCKAPPSRCDSHHIWHWMHGGPTNLANLALLCHKHHHQLHTDHLTIEHNPDGTWTTGQQPRAP